MTTSLIEIVLEESIDVYSLPDMESRGMKFDILKEDPFSFSATFEVSGKTYQVDIAKGKGMVPKSYDLSFGDVQSNGIKNVSTLLNSGVPLPVCSRVFSFLRYYVDKYNIDNFSYMVDGDIRSNIYDKYLEKHFPDYSKEVSGLPKTSTKLVVCKKI